MLVVVALVDFGRWLLVSLALLVAVFVAATVVVAIVC